MTINDLLMLLFTYDSERLFNLDRVRKIILAFVKKKKSVAVFRRQSYEDLFDDDGFRFEDSGTVTVSDVNDADLNMNGHTGNQGTFCCLDFVRPVR